MTSRLGSLAVALLFLAVCKPLVGQVEPKKARMIDSFGPAPTGHVRGVLDLFLAELVNDPEGSGQVYVYGTVAQVAARTRLIKNHFGFRNVPLSRVTFIGRPNNGEVRSDLWLIPKGAAPEIKPEAWIASEFGRVYKKDAVKKIEAYFKELWKLDDHQGYIINYGTPAQIALRERWIRDSITFRGYDPPRITLVNGGSGPQRTVMWLVPPGTENPKP